MLIYSKLKIGVFWIDFIGFSKIVIPLAPLI